MSDDSGNLWYQLGYAVEQARALPTRDRVQALGEKLAAFRAGGQVDERSPSSSRALVPTRKSGDTDTTGLEWLVAALSGGLASRILRYWPGRSRPGPALLVRGAAAGAAAVIFQELIHALLAPDDESLTARAEGVTERALSGTARGVLYAAVLEPRIPGSPLLRGAVFGTAEYLLSPLGGLNRILGKAAPWGRIPILREMLGKESAAEGGDDDTYLEHLVFGVAMALMAGETLRSYEDD